MFDCSCIAFGGGSDILYVASDDHPASGEHRRFTRVTFTSLLAQMPFLNCQNIIMIIILSFLTSDSAPIWVQVDRGPTAIYEKPLFVHYLKRYQDESTVEQLCI